MSGDRLVQALAALRASKHSDRMVQFTTIDFRGPSARASASAPPQQLEADVKAGALGVGEMNKSFGLTAKKADGTRLKLDDPELDPVWQTAARLNIPVFIHTADPQEFFGEMDCRTSGGWSWRSTRIAGGRRRRIPRSTS